MADELVPLSEADRRFRAVAGMLQTQLRAVQLCQHQKLTVPTLILTYSTIDILAHLGHPQDGTKVMDCFLYWVNKYLLPGSGLTCRAVDIYGARCGIVHSYSPDSALSRQGNARRLLYAWGASRPEDLEKALRDINLQEPYDSKKYAIVHLDGLVTALNIGVERFLEDIGKSEQKMRRLERRAKDLFTELPSPIVAELLRVAE